jgi:hypothetical protein
VPTIIDAGMIPPHHFKVVLSNNVEIIFYLGDGGRRFAKFLLKNGWSYQKDKPLISDEAELVGKEITWIPPR